MPTNSTTPNTDVSHGPRSGLRQNSRRNGPGGRCAVSHVIPRRPPGLLRRPGRSPEWASCRASRGDGSAVTAPPEVPPSPPIPCNIRQHYPARGRSWVEPPPWRGQGRGEARTQAAKRVRGARRATAAASAAVSTSRSRKRSDTRRPAAHSRSRCTAPVAGVDHGHAPEQAGVSLPQSQGPKAPVGGWTEPRVHPVPADGEQIGCDLRSVHTDQQRRPRHRRERRFQPLIQTPRHLGGRSRCPADDQRSIRAPGERDADRALRRRSAPGSRSALRTRPSTAPRSCRRSAGGRRTARSGSSCRVRRRRRR